MFIRFLDIFFSSFAILVLSPMLIPVIIILRFTGEGEVFFLQKRVGINEKSFYLFKFATMKKNSPNIATGTVTIKNDPRVLPVGKFLRKTKINELPQLINVLLGHMSIIGPRPLTTETFESYPDYIKQIIFNVRPGLSGIGSIIFRDEENILDNQVNTMEFYENVIAPYKGSLEEWFVLNRNLYIYFLLIFLTVWVIIFSKSSLPWKMLKNLPQPPDKIKNKLGL